MQTGNKRLGDVSGQDAKVSLEKNRSEDWALGQAGEDAVEVCKNSLARGGGEEQGKSDLPGDKTGFIHELVISCVRRYWTVQRKQRLRTDLDLATWKSPVT